MIVDPAVVPVGVPACLSNVNDAVRVIGVVTDEVAWTVALVGVLPLAVAVLTTDPASTSACVSVYVFVQVVVAPGASELTGQLTVPTFGSVTPTLVSVTLPVFFTRNEYAIVAPTALPLGVPAVLLSVIPGPGVTVVSTESVAVVAAPFGP